MDPAVCAVPQARPETTTVTPTGKATVIPETPPPPSSLALARMRRAHSHPSPPALSFPLASLFPGFSQSCRPAQRVRIPPPSPTAFRPERVRFDRPPRKPDKHISPLAPAPPAPPRCQPTQGSRRMSGSPHGACSQRAARSPRPRPEARSNSLSRACGRWWKLRHLTHLSPVRAVGSPRDAASSVPAPAQAGRGRAAGRSALAAARPLNHPDGPHEEETAPRSPSPAPAAFIPEPGCWTAKGRCRGRLSGRCSPGREGGPQATWLHAPRLWAALAGAEGSQARTQGLSPSRSRASAASGPGSQAEGSRPAWQRRPPGPHGAPRGNSPV